MGQPHLTAEQKADLWKRWKDGQSLSDIARALQRCHSTVESLLFSHGGFAPRARHRSEAVLTLAEREEISRGICAGTSFREIARALQRAPSTVSREVARHGGRCRYRAARAEIRAWHLAQRPKPCRLARYPRLRDVVAAKLQCNWSPEQISRWLEIAYIGDESMRVSHETIYRSLFVQARGVLKKELLGHLRSKRRMRYAKKSASRSPRQGQIIDAVSIRERPAECSDRAVPGHWEGDLLCGAKSQIATLVERRSRFVMLVKVPNKSTATVVKALSAQVRKLPRELRRSLTWDRGLELASHKELSLATQVKVYFCDPRSPWQRGTNENTNGLLRQYFPKSSDLSAHSQADLNKVALQLNQRPRKTLGFKTPADTFDASVASTD